MYKDKYKKEKAPILYLGEEELREGRKHRKKVRRRE